MIREFLKILHSLLEILNRNIIISFATFKGVAARYDHDNPIRDALAPNADHETVAKIMEGKLTPA